METVETQESAAQAQAKAPRVFGTGGGTTLAGGTHVATGITVTFAGTAIAELIDVGQSGMKSDTENSTGQTPTGNYETFEPSGLVDPGEFTLKVVVTGALPAVGTVGSLVVTHPIMGAWTYANSIMTGFDWTGNLKKLMTGNIKFKLSGVPTFAGTGG